MSIRDALHTEMLAALAHEPQWHYAQSRPIPLSRIAHKPQPIYPITTDCSGSVIGLYRRVGLPDPSGNDYDGQGWTGSLLANGTRTRVADLEVGDGVILANGAGDTEHVSLVQTPGTDPELWSHGFEGGPLNLRLSQQLRLHPGTHAIGVSWIDDEDADQPARKPRWVVQTGSGQVLAKTQTPARWALTHWRAFRKYGVISFHKR